ncbi:MAG TPA: hypothetical protein VG225_09415 [Terracidiphilus sp.]|nr:hypothetical protein [Terracidiphilus sp.]
MNDWKDALVVAAKQLKLEQGLKKAVQSKATPLNNKSMGHSQGSKTTSLPMSEVANSVAPISLPPPMTLKRRPKATAQPDLSAKSVPSGGRIVFKSPQQILPRKPAIRHDSLNLRSHKPVSSPRVKPASPPVQVPDMRFFSFVYPHCEARTDQSWQQQGVDKVVGPILPGRKSFSIVGLDFGTAYTKACIRIRNRTYVVHWDGAANLTNSFLLPSVFSIMPDGACVLGPAGEGKLISDIKMGLIGGMLPECRIHAVVFIALATRYIRSWVFSKHRDIVEGFELIWKLNMGLPARSWDTSALCADYRGIALSGWNLGFEPGNITLESARSALHESAGSRTQADMDHDGVAVFPEFGAQVHSYRSTAQRQKDLHLLLDIGAGTVDVVTFHIGDEEGEEVNCILDALVKNHGTHVLLGFRALAGSLTKSTWEDSATRYNRIEFESAFALRSGCLRQVQDDFADQLHRSIRRIFHDTKSHRYPNSPAWTEGIPFFLTGGGGQIDAYRDVVRRCAKDRTMIELALPIPQDVELGRMVPEQFHRVSVAHGLSFLAENLTRTLRRSEVPDMAGRSSLKEDYRERYIEK